MSNQSELLEGNVKEIFFKDLIPSVGGMMGISLYVLGDTMLIGRGLENQSLGLLFGIGGATFLSKSRGQSKAHKVNDIFTNQLLWLF